MRLLSKTFPSVKPPTLKKSRSTDTIPSTALVSISRSKPEKSTSSSWWVYLILSTKPPIKTYVGVTNNFSRRLKQHNGELVGGAKASRAGRPWVCACIIQGFDSQSEACKFESKWKSLSRKLRRNGKNDDTTGHESQALVQHRKKALSRVEGLFNSNNVQVQWKINP
ncbi:structure-specific endonuclease subunit slx1 [Euphorbia lathyris]|uniref:structure-specific endonuclease subunit slx1 n=1 Tax=Euphorbia lathyris TaxID=212925 RepID=UPI0033132B2A